MARSRSRDALRLGSILLAMAAIGGGSGCFGKDPYRPGESIGIFQVSAKLLSTTCGATPDPWQFEVRLRHERTTLYWVQGDAPISGLVDPTARAVLESSDVRTMREADARSKMAACAMSRDDLLDLALEGLEAPVTDLGGATSFKGTLAYHFAATAGSDCEDQLAQSGGDFAALPCDVKYELRGARTGDAK